MTHFSASARADAHRLSRAFITFLTGAVLLSLFPVAANAAALISSAPAATVARSQKEVLVMDFNVPIYNGDTIVDADGAVTEDVGVSTVRTAAPLYTIPASARLAYGIGGQSDPQSIWIDRDGSKKYTPNLTADTTVAQSDVLGLPLPDGDVSASLKNGGTGSLKILVSDPNELNTWHPSERDALYKDIGTVANLIDSNDVRISASVRFRSESALVSDKAMILLRNSTNTCPMGIAAEDLIHIVGKQNIGVKEVVYDREPTSGACIAQVILYTQNYPYSIDDQFGIVTPYLGELDINDLKDNGDNGVPDAQTRSIKVLSGTLKGIAVGDTLRIARGAQTIEYRVDDLSTLAKVMTVAYLQGTLEGPPGEPYAAAIVNQKAYSGILSGLLSGLPNWVKYVDEDNDNTWDNAEPLYSDEDASGLVSKNDKRLTGVTAEKRLLKKVGAIDFLSGFYVDTASMNAPKWFSETKPWVEGSDIIIDHDNDGFYNLDVLTQMTVKNDGTATETDTINVELWMEDNGMGGFQGTFSGQPTDLRLGSFTYLANNNRWQLSGLNQPLISGERFYVTANIASNAFDQRTLRFAVIKDGIKSSHRLFPDTHSPNSATQTISAAAQLPPEQQAPPPVVSAKNSIVRVIDRLTVPADGVSTATIEVEVRSSADERLSGQTVRLERLRAAENNVLSTEQKVTNGLGIASFPVSSQESGVFRFRGKVGSILIGSVTLTFTPANGEPPPAPGGLKDGDLFMSAGAGVGGTVYYFANGKKYPFPNEKVYLSWFTNFSSVTIKKIAPADIGSVPWGTNVRYRPGTRMVKVPDDLKVYAVTTGGKVCWVKDEDVAKKFYGATWNKKIDDLLASLFVGTYRNDPTCDLTLNSKYPTGTILSMNSKNYYMDGARVRLIDDAAWTSNRFRNEFALSVSSLDGYEVGPPVNSGEFSRVVD